MSTTDKKVDNPENQSWVNVDFQKFACHKVIMVLNVHRNHKAYGEKGGGRRYGGGERGRV